jgi:hypothetical protein
MSTLKIVYNVESIEEEEILRWGRAWIIGPIVSLTQNPAQKTLSINLKKLVQTIHPRP